MPNPTATVVTNRGTIKIELYGDKTPQTVKNFVTLARSGYYDGQKFHRIIDGFMIQGGDPLTKDDSKARLWGTGGPGYTIVDEFPLTDGRTSDAVPTTTGLALRFTGAGILAMANTGRARTGGSQFFITLEATSHLDGRHTIFGKVVEGMDVVKTIGGTETDANDRPRQPVVVQKVTIEGQEPPGDLQKFSAR